MSRHPELEQLLAADGPAGEGRDALLSHLRGCAACRAGLAEADPSRLFALLAHDELPQDALDRLSRNVAREIEQLEQPPAGRRFYAPIAASLALAGLLGIYLWTRPVPSPGPAPASVVPAVAEVDGPRAEPQVPVAGMELISSPGNAEVVAFSVGEAQIVMIFDKDLDI